MEKKVSVIIPVFNVERYLPDCLNSIVNQTYKNLEIILIDDGSTDRSGIICDQCAAAHKEIVVRHQSNCGVSNARNNGLLMASGDYINFVDPGDCLDYNTYGTMISLMEETMVDISFFEFLWFDKKIPEKQLVASSINNICILEKEDRINIPLRYSGSSCNCIYNSTLIKGQKFSEDFKLSEDTLFLVEALLKADSTLFVNQKLYFRRRRQDSASRTKYNPEWIKTIDVVNKIMSMLMQSSDTYANIASYILYSKIYELLSKLSQDYNNNLHDVYCIQTFIKSNYKNIEKNPFIPIKGKLVIMLFRISPKLFYRIKTWKGV